MQFLTKAQLKELQDYVDSSLNQPTSCIHCFNKDEDEECAEKIPYYAKSNNCKYWKENPDSIPKVKKINVKKTLVDTF
jgi:hypothetical protein